jgi:hypothetical protein
VARPPADGEVPRILIVDDALINRLVSGRMLAHLGYEVTSVESGALALDALDATAFSLILTDCYMPDMDGFQLTQEIRRHDPRVPIIAMTADVLEETRERCLACGMDDYLTKPLQLEQLEQALARWGLAPRPKAATRA